MDAANDNGLPRTRAEAKAIGSKHYFTGEPCKHGHVAPRFTVDHACTTCRHESRLRRREDPKYREAENERENARRRERYATDPAYREGIVEKNKEARRDPTVRLRDRVYQAERRRDPEIAKTQREYKRKRRKDPKVVARDRERTKQLRLKDKSFRLHHAISCGIRKSIKDGTKARRTWESLVGYTLAELRQHLEKKFQPGMSWDNYGEWHVDHRIPKSAFNYETPDDIDFKRCWALSNLQPLWAADNISKGKKLATPFQPSLLIATNDNRKPPQKETA